MGEVIDMMQAQSCGEFVSRLSREHGVRLVRFLHRMLGDKQLAEDVAQDAYLKLYRLSRPTEVRCPRALLFDVATKLAIDQLRKVHAESAADYSGVQDEMAAKSPMRPDHRAILDEVLQRLTRIVCEMKPSMRHVFVLRYVRQMPRQEIADHLHISLGAVEQRLTRALTHCRKQLTAQGIDWIISD